MTPEQLRRVRDLFEAALDRDDADATRWVAEAAGDPDVAAEVVSLLQQHARAGAFLAEPLAGEYLTEEERLLGGAALLAEDVDVHDVALWDLGDVRVGRGQ